MTNKIQKYFARHAGVIAGGIIVLSLVGIFGLQAATISGLSSEIKTQNKVIAQIKGLAIAQQDNAQSRTDQINALSKHIDCIVKLFSEPSRDDKVIADIDSCSIHTKTSSQPTVTQTQSQPVVSGETSPQATKPKGKSAPNKKITTTPTAKAIPKPTVGNRIGNTLRDVFHIVGL